MKLFFCSSDVGCFEFLFTTDEQRAMQLFAIYTALAGVKPTSMKLAELTTISVIPEHREHLQEALSRDCEAFASYEDGRGWVMRLVQDMFDELSHEASQGGAA